MYHANGNLNTDTVDCSVDDQWAEDLARLSSLPKTHSAFVFVTWGGYLTYGREKGRGKGREEEEKQEGRERGRNQAMPDTDTLHYLLVSCTYTKFTFI